MKIRNDRNEDKKTRRFFTPAFAKLNSPSCAPQTLIKTHTCMHIALTERDQSAVNGKPSPLVLVLFKLISELHPESQLSIVL